MFIGLYLWMTPPAQQKSTISIDYDMNRDREILTALCRAWPVYPKSNLRLAVSAACSARYSTIHTKEPK